MSSFEKNKSLDEALTELNDKLFLLEKKEMESAGKAAYPNLLLFGNSRTGSTLFLQWMASQKSFSYPSNFLSRLYKAPYIGALIYNIVTKPEYQYKNEFSDINSDFAFSSTIGKTEGFKSPHEFWYFWRRFIDFPPNEPFTEEEFAKKFDFDSANQELALIQKAFGKPFLLKGKIMNFYLKSLSDNLENVIYIHLHRDPVPVVRSLLKAREKWTGSKENWFSWKPRELDFLQTLDIYYQVAGQVYFIDKEILSKRKYLGNRYFPVTYEDYCLNPQATFDDLVSKIQEFAPEFQPGEYNNAFQFKISNPISEEDEKIRQAYAYFEENYGKLKFE